MKLRKKKEINIKKPLDPTLLPILSLNLNHLRVFMSWLIRLADPKRHQNEIDKKDEIDKKKNLSTWLLT